MDLRYMKITNATRGIRLAEKGEIAHTFTRRLKGLLFTDSLPSGQGILLKPCSSVHTIGMSYRIDVLFLDSKDMVIKAVLAMKPWRVSSCVGSAYVIELPAGTLGRTRTQIGDTIVVS